METTFDNYIEQIVQLIFSTTLNMEVGRAECAPSELEEKLLATIQITGDRSMSVLMSVSPGVSRVAAAAMLQVPENEVTDADEWDVVAELTNMVGGNLKSMLPQPLFLSLPTVVEGRHLEVLVPGAELMEDVMLACEAGLLRVRLYRQLAA